MKVSISLCQYCRFATVSILIFKDILKSNLKTIIVNSYMFMLCTYITVVISVILYY